MSKIYPSCKEDTSKKESKMFSTPIMSRIANIVCPPAPIKMRVEYPTAIIIDNGKLHEIIIHPRSAPIKIPVPINRRLVF
jgi:hypothetical protein